MNVLGEKIAEGNPQPPHFMLDMSAYATGTYLLKVVGEHGEFGLEKVLHLEKTAKCLIALSLAYWA